MTAPAEGPTIVLIGGMTTLDSGERIDSRQRLAGDKWDCVLRSAMAYSERWWESARTLADVLLDQDEGEGAWALVWAPRTMRRLKQDGSTSRVRLRSVLPEAALLMDLWRNDSGGSSTIDASKTNARYRVLEHPLRYKDIEASRPPTVFFGIHPTAWDTQEQTPFDAVLRRWPNTVMVLAHTPLLETAVDELRAWFAAGRPNREKSVFSERELRARDSIIEDLQLCQEKFKDYQPVVVDADFKVTYFLDNGVAGNAADLDAALAFVLSRYDLKFGLWDLARDPGLRESLLSPEELEATRSPSATIPAPSATIPAKLKASAIRSKTARMKKARSEEDSRERLHGVLWPHLKKRGWRTWDGKAKGRSYILPMAAYVKWSEFYDPAPILYCELAVTKKQSSFRFKSPPFEFSGRSEFLVEHGDALKQMTKQPPSKDVLCRFESRGWFNESWDWEQILPSIDAIVEFLLPKMPSLSAKAEGAFAIHKAQYPGLQATSGGTPSVLGMVNDKPKSGFWRKLFRG